MQCPSCQQLLTEIIYEQASIQSCDGCGGEFLGAAEIAHIVRTRDERFPMAMQTQLADRQPSFGTPPSATGRTLNCPACAAGMEVINYFGDTGIFIDRCTMCSGLWLDCHELEKIQILVERWADQAPQQLRQIAGRLERVKQETSSRTANAFAGSRFAFVNALINRLLDAA